MCVVLSVLEKVTLLKREIHKTTDFCISIEKSSGRLEREGGSLSKAIDLSQLIIPSQFSNSRPKPVVVLIEQVLSRDTWSDSGVRRH